MRDEVSSFEKWLKVGYNGEMDYMERNFDKRLDPRLLVPGAKTVISLLYNYYPKEKQIISSSPKISKYAYGQDYHDIIKKKLRLLMEFIHEKIGNVEGRVFVDSAPVLDRAWAKKSGLGWIGKNTNLINKNHGSFFFIAELIIDLQLEPDASTTSHCGTCTACIDACPTQAIEQEYIVNSSKCISYLTIELKSEIPQSFKGKMDDWIFGCDICQDVCPWNKFATPHNEPLLIPNTSILNFSSKEWHEITEDIFKKIFKKSPVKRAKYTGLTRNLKFIRK